MVTMAQGQAAPAVGGPPCAGVMPPGGVWPISRAASVSARLPANANSESHGVCEGGTGGSVAWRQKTGSHGSHRSSTATCAPSQTATSPTVLRTLGIGTQPDQQQCD